MKIFNINVYGLEESMVASGYPMQTKVGDMDDLKYIDWETMELDWDFLSRVEKSPHLKRAEKLGSTPIGTGHDNFIQGIIVQADFQMPSYWWPEAQRYHWFDFVSSQSKMHCILKFNLGEQCIEGTDSRIIVVTKEYIQKYNENPTNENFENILKNTPMGLELTARMTMNYRQLKTMYAQRQHHRLSAWTKVFIPFVEGLPYAKELGILGGN